MLGNTSMDQDSPLACLLVGQPTLRRTMKLAVLAALVISSLSRRVLNVRHERSHLPGRRFIRGYLLPCP